jgi:hypothetical protein
MVLEKLPYKCFELTLNVVMIVIPLTVINVFDDLLSRYEEVLNIDGGAMYTMKYVLHVIEFLEDE